MSPGKRWQEYIGNTERTTEIVSRRALSGLAGVLGYPLGLRNGKCLLPWPDGDVPPFAQWLNANPVVARLDIGADGHSAKGGFIPDLGLPRRMWAGSRVEVHAPYSVHQELQHQKSITSIVPKTGRSGELVFVTISHEYHAEGSLVISEEQNLVYRAASTFPTPMPDIKPVKDIKSACQHDWFQAIRPDPVWLFQYSAVSLNAHRIHYDREYATREEGYPGLVVHGPLSAILLLDLYHRRNPEKRIVEFKCTATAPLFDLADFYLFGTATPSGAELCAVGPDGRKAMSVSLTANGDR